MRRPRLLTKRSSVPSAATSAAAAPTRISSAPAGWPPIDRGESRDRTMPILHVDRLRSGEPGGEEYQVVETTRLPPWGPDTAFTAVGRPQPRVEGAEKVTGRARYASDIRLPGQL